MLFVLDVGFPGRYFGRVAEDERVKVLVVVNVEDDVAHATVGGRCSVWRG